MQAFFIILLLILADVATGLLYAFFTKSFKSSIMREGAMHKLGEILAMALMYGLEEALPSVGITQSIPLVEIAAVYLALMEIGSIFENLGKMNPDIGELLNTLINKIRGGTNE